MIHTAIGSTSGKGWFAGPWSRSSTVVVAGHEVVLAGGDALFVEPGEAHTFTSSSADYLHFVVQAPFVSGDKRRA